MTTSRKFHDSEGEFAVWRPSEQPCHHKECKAKVRVRSWESSDGAYEDYQYACEAGHSWWIDGPDS